DTLPDLGFGEDPFPDDEFPAADPLTDPVVRGAAQEQRFEGPNGEKPRPQTSPFESVNHIEEENALPREPLAADGARLPESAREEVVVVAPQNDLHERITALVARSEGAGAISAAFLGLNDILDKHDAELTPADRELVNKTLDRLAYRVFYQPGENILWEEYQVGPNETLASIAQNYKITPEFLAAINSLHVGPEVLLPAGQALKVVKGPVSADVSFSKMELLLKFNGLYAGRFKMGYAQRAAQIRGEFPVTRKIKNPEYNGPLDNGQIGRIAGGDPRNPLGPCWIELGGGLGLQGTNHDEYVGGQTAGVGGLIFSNKDISHLNILLSQGSVVRISD
ncbi:MAG: LysM peptidoglycan-binding domain-containing protein, partial [Thermoguttaceae bacterium]|nr:LysM peptidoglycan-binding domain-containing protein [Thermoguttaceae bacterium]